MMRRSLRLLNLAAFYEFVDPNFLNNKRPPVPGGAWPVESLREKSLADLQQIWFALLREKNMLASTRQHYLKHQEELGAMPAPSRLTMVEESMANIKKVVRERDREAVDRATQTFHERIKRGVYRYPPGPPPPPGAHDPTVAVRLTLSRRVDADRLRELFGRFDVFAEHKGIVSVALRLPEAVLQQKQEAEARWAEYQAKLSDWREHRKWGPSLYDSATAELAPGVYAGEGGAAEAPVAAALPVPPPQQAPPLPRSPLERIKHARRSALHKAVIQLGYFPNVTLEAPEAAEPVRPTHPDEIEGPWEAVITYDARDGLDYARSLGITRIDGAEVLAVEEEPRELQPFARVDPVYQEAVNQEAAAEETVMQWPHAPQWKTQYDQYSRKHIAEVVRYNYSNVVDYMDREVLLTGRSVWECPITIDHTCGGVKSVPVHARRPEQFIPRGLDDVGVTDI